VGNITEKKVTYSPTILETVSQPNTPSGETNGNTGTEYTYTTGGSISSFGHSVQYRFDWGDGYSDWLAADRTDRPAQPNPGQRRDIRGSCPGEVRRAHRNGFFVVRDALGDNHGVRPRDGFSALCPVWSNRLQRPGDPCNYLTGGSSSSLGHSINTTLTGEMERVQAGWWWDRPLHPSPGEECRGYTTLSPGRCATHTLIESDWSPILSVAVGETISTPAMPDGPTTGSAGVLYSYSTGGSASNFSHSIHTTLTGEMGQIPAGCLLERPCVQIVGEPGDIPRKGQGQVRDPSSGPVTLVRGIVGCHR